MRTHSRRLHSIMQLTSLAGVERKSFADMDCSVAQCLEVVGEWWSMLIVRDVFLGVSRFDDFQRRLGISRNILQQRLARLVDAGVLTPGARIPSTRLATTTGSPTRAGTCGRCSPPCGSGGTATRLRRAHLSRSPTRRADRHRRSGPRVWFVWGADRTERRRSQARPGPSRHRMGAVTERREGLTPSSLAGSVPIQAGCDSRTELAGRRAGLATLSDGRVNEPGPPQGDGPDGR